MAREYTDGEIRQYIREVVREAKGTANVDTGSIGIYSVSGSVEYNCPTNCTFPES